MYVHQYMYYEQEQARASCDEEKSRINEKITIVLSKKNFIATELKKQMGELKRRYERVYIALNVYMCA